MPNKKNPKNDKEQQSIYKENIRFVAGLNKTMPNKKDTIECICEKAIATHKKEMEKKGIVIGAKFYGIKYFCPEHGEKTYYPNIT